MTSINKQLGLKRAGKRSMMKLPDNRSDAAALTAAKCPHCGARGVIENVIHGVRKRQCTWCPRSWEVEG